MLDRLMKCTGLSKSSAARVLANWVLLDVNELQSDAEAVVGNATFSEHMAWSCRNLSDPRNPFAGIEANDLSCRLGLPSMGRPHYAFGHILSPGSVARKPTAFDGGMYEHWVPGGVTKPHAPCEGKYPVGLPEVVHEANRFKNIYTSIRETSG